MPRHGDVPDFLGFDEVVGVFRVVTEVDLDPFDAAVECWVTRFVVIGDAAGKNTLPVAIFSLLELFCVTGSLAACNTRLNTFFWLVSHLVDAHSDRQDEDIVLPWLDLHTVGIAHSKPLLGHLGHLLPALADGVLMVENIALHF